MQNGESSIKVNDVLLHHESIFRLSFFRIEVVYFLIRNRMVCKTRSKCNQHIKQMIFYFPTFVESDRQLKIPFD